MGITARPPDGCPRRAEPLTHPNDLSDNLHMLVIGLVLLVAAIALYFFSHKNTTKARALSATANFTPAQLVKLHSDVARDADLAGAFVHEADVRGIARCGAPLTAPISSTPCVYFETRVVAKLEQRRVSTDSDGNRSTRWEHTERVVSDLEQRATFELHADGASLPVYANDARIDGALTTVDRFEPSNNGSISIGGMHFGGAPGDERLLGYQHVERIVPVDVRVFVHGSVDDSTGRLVFRSADGRPLMISMRSEAEITAGALKSAGWQRIAAVGCGAVGTVLSAASQLAS